MDEGNGKVFWIEDCDDVAAAGSRCHLFDAVCREARLVRLDDPGAAMDLASALCPY